MLPDEDATNGLTVGGASLFVSIDQTEEEMQASADFIFFLTSTPNDMLWHMGSGYIPTRTSSYNNLVEEGYYEENPRFQVAVDQLIDTELNVASAGAVIGPSDLVREELISAFRLVINGEDETTEQLQAALDTAKIRADEILEDYNRDFE
jgi:sn-glycerol 3-phosphate transport system substrate-binding protein